MKFQIAWRHRLSRSLSAGDGGVRGLSVGCLSGSERVGGEYLEGSLVASYRVHSGTLLLWSLVLCCFGEACLVSLHLVAVALLGRDFSH